MQKVRLQIMVSYEELNKLHKYQLEHQIKKEGEALFHMMDSYERLQFVIKQLETKANEAEEWRKRAVNKKLEVKPDGNSRSPAKA